MPSSSKTCHRFALALGLSAGAPLACALPTDAGNDGGADGGPHEELRAQVMNSVAYQAVAPTFENANTEAKALEASTAAYVLALGSADEGEALVAARDAWRTSMSAWQRVEMMQLGPAGASSKVIGGADRRDEAYSWPSTNSCRVDQELVLGEFEAEDFTSTRLVNTYGLDAIEYLLFHAGPDNTCAPQLPINAEGEWATLDEQQLRTSRANYAAAIAHALALETTELAAAWSPDDGSFTRHLADPRDADSPYENLPTAMNEVLRAMFYLDTTVKDVKVAVPAGILDCASAPCISELESTWARHNQAIVTANLVAFSMLFHGGESADSGTGFDDLLVAYGEEALATKMTADIEAALAAVAAVEASFAEALAADPLALDASHAAIREITDSLKGDFATILMLTVPSEAAGDAD